MKAEANSNEPTVVIGTSMGGVVSKYALLKMEQGGDEYDVSKLFTWDSPLRGAHMPLAFQYLIQHLALYKPVIGKPLGEANPILGEAYATLFRRASQELLLLHGPSTVGYDQSGYTGNRSLTSPQHDSFYDELMGLGELQATRTIQLSNGSETGVDLPVPPSSQLFDVSLNGNNVTNLAWFEILDTDDDGHSPWHQVFGTFFYFVLGQGGGFQIEGYSMPDPGVAATVYDGKISTHLLWGLVSATDPFKVSTLPGHALPNYDRIPGGTEKFETDDIPGLYVFHPVFAFSPNFSSQNIDISQSNIDLTAYYDNPQPLIAADRIAASDLSVTLLNGQSTQNTPHVSTTAKISNTLVEELITPAATHGINAATTPGPAFNFGTNARAPGSPCFPRFPYASSARTLDESVTLGSGESLWVNRQGRIQDPSRVGTDNNFPGCTESFYYPENTGVPFTLTLGYDKCDGQPAHVTVDAGGELLIGQWSVGYTGTVVVPSGTEIEIKSGGELNVKPIHGSWCATAVD